MTIWLVLAVLIGREYQRLVASVGGGEGWLRRSDVADFGSENELSVRRLLAWGRSLSGTPYRWGGRSPLGFDCSGFVQYLAALALRHLPRDASQQAAYGEEVTTSSDGWEPGDLLFFGDPIDHVGIHGGRGRILHCSGRVREEKLSQNPRLKARLCAVRRPWPHLDLLQPTLWGARPAAGESS